MVQIECTKFKYKKEVDVRVPPFLKIGYIASIKPFTYTKEIICADSICAVTISQTF
jgi:hypothetical protein